MESAKDTGKNVGDNVYQNSLDVLYNCATSKDDIEEIDTTTRDIACSIAKKYVQKLVDKEIPKKPKDNKCPHCLTYGIYTSKGSRLKRCGDCGQLLDWSKDE